MHTFMYAHICVHNFMCVTQSVIFFFFCRQSTAQFLHRLHLCFKCLRCQANHSETMKTKEKGGKKKY